MTRVSKKKSSSLGTLKSLKTRSGCFLSITGDKGRCVKNSQTATFGRNIHIYTYFGDFPFEISLSKLHKSNNLLLLKLAHFTNGFKR